MTSQALLVNPSKQKQDAATGLVKRSTQGSRLPFWIVTATIGLALAASGAPSPLYVDYQQRWHFSSTTLTTIYAMYAGGVIITLLLAGGLSDRIGRRRVLLGSVSALIGSLVIFLFANDTGWLFLARGVQGLATGVFTGAAAAALTELHPRRDARAAGLVNSASTSTGIALGAVGSGALAQWAPLPLRIPYVLLIVLALLLLAAIALKVPETVPNASTAGGLGRLLRPQRLGVAPGVRGAFVIGSLGVLASWSVGGLYLSLGGSLAKELLHVNNHLIAGLVILTVQGVGGVSQLAFTSRTNRANAVIGFLSLITGMGVVSLSLSLSSPVLFLCGDLITGVGFGLAFMSGTRRVTEAAPADKRGEVLAAYFVVAYLAISVPVIAVGMVSAHIGLAHTFYIFAAIMSMVAVVALIGTLLYRPKI
jgi:MFS family permease